MITTPQLIDVLAGDARPVRRLARPVVRAASWLALALLVIGLLALAYGVRPDLALRIGQPLFVTGMVASLATGVLAALAAFTASLPDRSQRWLLLPLPTLVVWVATVGYGCLADWVVAGPEREPIGETARCIATLLSTSIPLAVALFAMLRHALVLRRAGVVIVASLAVAAMTSSALALFHRFDASAMILLWNLGVAAAIVALGGVLAVRGAPAAAR
jgi:hypothetical protein